MRLIYTTVLLKLSFAVPVFNSSCSNESAHQIMISNPAEMDRPDEMVVLSRLDIEKHWAKLATGKYVTFRKRDGPPIAVQYDDLNGDGNWDEMVFLYSFKPLEKLTLIPAIEDAPVTVKAVVRAHVRHMKRNADNSFGPALAKDTMPPGNPPTDFSKQPLPPYLTEGPAWENDKLAFRLYFDSRNGKDVFGKITTRMVMDSVGTKLNNSYHELADWGMDLLHVGQSLGAGAIAIATQDNNGKDTLIRLGGKDVKRETFEVISDGPVRAVFRIKYDWEINGKPVIVEDETSIWGGQYFYQSRVTVSGIPSDAKLVTGIANFYDNIRGEADQGGSKTFYSFGPQSENRDKLGLAVMIRAEDFDHYSKSPDSLREIRNTYIIAQKIRSLQPVSYRFYVGWEKTDDRFKTEKGFIDFLKSEALKNATPLLIEWK